jgi:putative PEP-CTERM system TPR-repeat lipoprotein
MNKIIITSAITLALSLSACSEQKTVEQLIASANQYSQQGKFSNAIIDYKNAVRLAPKSAEARIGLGQAYLNQGNYISAEKELDRAVVLGVSYAQAATLLAQVKTRLDKSEEVEQLVKLSEELSDNVYVTVLSYAGMATLANGQTAKAQDYFSQAAAILPDNVYSKLSQAYLLYIERDFSQGLPIINTLLTEQGVFAEASLLQGFLYFALTDFEQASDSFEQYLVSYPLDNNIRFFLVNSLIKAGKFEQADALTDKLLAVFKKSPLALQYKAQIAFQADEFLKAREFASQAVGYDESFIIAKMIAGVSSYKLEELEQAYDYLISLESMLPATHPINVILLSIKIKLGHSADLASSVARLTAIKDSNSDSDLLQITSLELMKIGDYTNAQSLINKAAQVSPSSAAIKVQRGAFLLSQGDLSGIKSLEQALILDPSLHETEFALARQYIQGNEMSKAQAIAEKWLASEQHQISGNLLSGMISLQEEKEFEAEAYFNKALSLDNHNVSALYGLASVYGYKKQTAEAILGYEKVLELNPNHYQAILRYNSLQANQGNTASAISYLNSLYEQNKLNGLIHKNLVIGIALNLIRSKQQVGAIDLLESIKEESNLPVKYWSILANTYALNKQYDKASFTLKEGVKVNINNYDLRVAYISTLTRIKKLSEALALARQTNQDFPHDESLMTTLAYLELVNNNVAAAKVQLKSLAKQGGTNDLSVQLTAKLAMMEKNYQQAITLYRAMYKKDPSGVNIINLSRSLQFSNQSAQAEQAIENYLNENNDDNKVRMLLAELYLKNNSNGDKSDKIIRTYKEAVIVQPDNIAALNNLAWQEYLSNDLDNALQHIEQAIAIDPNALTLQESYGVILVANEKFTQAIKVLTVIQDKGSVEVKAKVALAEAYIATNQLEKANILLTGLSAHNSKVNAKIVQLRQSVSID